MSFSMHTAAERPDLWERGIASESVWPEYNLHGDVLNQWWGHLDEDLADYQFVLYDEAADEVVAEGHTGPLWWDGSDATLPPGIDDALVDIFARARSGEPVNTLCALAAESPREGRARGLAVQILGAMRTIAERQGLTHLVAPVRPSLKERYPHDADRTLRRAGGATTVSCSTPGCGSTNGSARGSPAPCRSRCGSPARSRSGSRGPGWSFPESGDYVFPEGLAPVHIDRDGGPSAPTGSRTCGWCTPTSPPERSSRARRRSPGCGR